MVHTESVLGSYNNQIKEIKLTSAGWYFVDELFCPTATVVHDEITNSKTKL